MLASQGWQKDGQADTGLASQDEPEAVSMVTVFALFVFKVPKVFLRSDIARGTYLTSLETSLG